MSEKLKEYIKNISVSCDKFENLNVLKELSNMLLLENFDDAFLMCLELLSSFSNINSIVGSVVNENMDLIIKNKFSIIYSNLYFSTFIEIYCMNNDIVIESDENLDYDLSYSEDYYYNSIKETPVLSREEEQQLFKLYSSPDPVISSNARKQLIKSNLRLVVSIASKYRNKYVAFDDIVSEGNIGLMKAISYFDVSKGYKFSTYAIWWIRQSISRFLSYNSSIVRLPINFKSKVTTYERFVKEWQEEYGISPSLEEIMVNTGFSSDDIILIQQHADGIASLESPIGEDKDSFLGDFIPDLSASVEESFDRRNFISSLYDIFKELNFDDRDIDIVVMRLGLDGNGERTLEEIGNKYGITRERVRQKFAKAISKIRKYKKRVDLEEKRMMTKN